MGHRNEIAGLLAVLRIDRNRIDADELNYLRDTVEPHLEIERSVRGAVAYYMWMQIIAGWLLSAIFVAGVTGLIRND